ncbi:MAG: hypothetical protein IIB33_02945 [Chloroflexi bacterium]|nr:hypothetical protein [Chloroflexota bacterium]
MSRVLTGLLAFLIIGTVAACGGGGEPTATATATPILSGEVIDISASNAGLDPQTFQLQLGTTYVIRFTNASASNTYRLIVEQYDINLEPLPGKNVVSDPFTESEAGEYPCFEFNRGSLLTNFQCTLVFS